MGVTVGIRTQACVSRKRENGDGLTERGPDQKRSTRRVASRSDSGEKREVLGGQRNAKTSCCARGRKGWPI